MALSLIRRGVPLPVGGVRGTEFGRRLIDFYGMNEVWALTDIEVGGTTIIAAGTSARNGTVTGWALQDQTSPIASETTKAPYSDGTNDYGDILTSNGSTGIVDIFDPNEGTVLIWAQLEGVAETIDGVGYRMFSLEVDGNNRIVIGKDTADKFTLAHIAGATARIITGTAASVGWHMLGLSWSAADTKVFAQLDGAQYDVDQAAPGTWAGALAIALIGAETTVPATVFKGWEAYAAVKFGSYLTTAQMTAIYNEAITP